MKSFINSIAISSFALAVSHSIIAEPLSRESSEKLKQLEQKISSAVSQIAINEQAAGNDLQQLNVSVAEPNSNVSYLGLMLSTNPETGHVTVMQVEEGSLADTLALQKGDQLIAINQYSLTNTQSKNLAAIVAGIAHQGDIEITAQRNGKLVAAKGKLPKIAVPGYQLSLAGNQTETATEQPDNTLVLLDKDIDDTNHFVPLHTLPECMDKKCVSIYKKYRNLAREPQNLLAKLRRAEFKYAGFGVEKDVKKALSHFKYLSAQPIPHAAYMAGVILNESNDSDATKYFKKAADNGHHLAALELSKIYLSQAQPKNADSYLKQAIEGQSLAAIQYVKALMKVEAISHQAMPELMAYLKQHNLYNLDGLQHLERQIYASNSSVPDLSELTNVSEVVLKQRNKPNRYRLSNHLVQGNDGPKQHNSSLNSQ